MGPWSPQPPSGPRLGCSAVVRFPWQVWLVGILGVRGVMAAQGRGGGHKHSGNPLHWATLSLKVGRGRRRVHSLDGHFALGGTGGLTPLRTKNGAH